MIRPGRGAGTAGNRVLWWGVTGTPAPLPRRPPAGSHLPVRRAPAPRPGPLPLDTDVLPDADLARLFRAGDQAAAAALYRRYAARLRSAVRSRCGRSFASRF